MAMENKDKIWQINLDENMLQFQFIENMQVTSEISLHAGYQIIANTYFNQPIPTEAETEYAINYIEDVLMSDNKLVSNHEALQISSVRVDDIFQKNGLEDRVVSRKAVEDLFSKYAYVIMGRSAVIDNVEINRDDFAIVLLLREIMHHLNFKELNLDGLSFTSNPIFH